MKAIYLILASVTLAGVATLWTGQNMQTKTTEALEFSIRQNHHRNEQLLERLFEESLANIHNIVQETSRSTDLLYGVLSANQQAVETQLYDVLSRHSGERIDALVIDTGSNQRISSTSFAVLEAEIDLEPLLETYQGYNRWTVMTTHQNNRHYIALRNVQPVIDAENGEVVARLNALILLNDNFWVMSEILSLLDANSVSLIRRGDKLGSLTANESVHPQLNPATQVFNTVEVIRQYHISFATGEDFRLSVNQRVDDSGPLIAMIHYWSNYITIAGICISLLGLIAIGVVVRSGMQSGNRAGLKESIEGDSLQSETEKTAPTLQDQQ